jgi:hypothetical protein
MISAFPMAVPENWDSIQDGMTLRDWFAGQVLNGLFSGNNVGGPIDDLAQRAYLYADAMLDVRDDC